MPYLVGSTALVGTKHDDVRRSVGELLSVEGCIVLEELHVGTTALEAICSLLELRDIPNLAGKPTLKLDFVLNNKGVIFVVNGLGELGGDGMVSRLVLDDQSLVTLHTLQYGRLLNGPSTNICPFLVIGLDVLLRV